MKAQHILKSLLNAWLIYSMTIFISCASKETVETSEGMDGEDSAELAEAGEGEDIGLLEEGAEEEGDEASLSEAAESEEEEEELSALEGELSEEKEAPAATDEFAAASDSEGDDLAGLDAEATDKSEDGELDAMMDGASELSDAPVADAPAPQETASFDALNTDTSAPEPAPSSDSGFFGGDTSGTPRTVVSKSPEIPTQAMDKNGTLLNRYYFVREGDTAEQVSQLIYGTPQRAGDLQKWNKGSWRAGKVVYYASPTDAADYQMRSFYQERGITPETHTLAKGEWLSTLAQNKYGAAGSWKEIAVVNGLPSPDSVSPGTQLSLYPKDLSAFSEATNVAQAPPMVPSNESAPMADQQMFQPEQAPPPADAGAAIAPPGGEFAQAPELPSSTDTFSPPAPEEGAAKKKKSSAMGKLIQKNLFSIAVGGVIVFLLLSLLVINRRKKAATLEDDYREDDTYSPPKAQRN